MKEQIVREIRKDHAKQVRHWKQIYYIPKWFISELVFGLTPEGEKGLQSLPENTKCEECSKTLWHCQCAAELDKLQMPQ